MLASMLFARIWRALTGRGDVPEATDKAKAGPTSCLRLPLHGIVFGMVKALVDRAGAKEFERLTGRWPGKRSPAQTGDQRLAGIYMPSGSTRTTSRQFASASDAFKPMSVMVDDLLESCPRRTAELR